MRLLGLSLLLLTYALPAFPCTGMQYGGGEKNTIAQNIGWYWEIDGAFVVNARHVEKSAAALYEGDEPATWTSTYGSVTLNPGGREFPVSGLNEAGLVVQGLQYLRGNYPAPASHLPSLHALQWIQYQLDTSKNVEEAIAHAQLVRPTGTKPLLLHYMVCELSGACATFDYDEQGKLLIYAGSALEIRALTNSAYADSLDLYHRCSVNPACDRPDDSLDRFIKATNLIRGYQEAGDPIRYGFYSLGVVQQLFPLTLWNAVVEDGNARKRYHLKGARHDAIQYVDLAGLDFSCTHPTQMQKVDLAAEGDVHGRFADYDPALQERLIRQSKHIFTEAQLQALVRYSQAGTHCLDR